MPNEQAESAYTLEKVDTLLYSTASGLPRLGKVLVSVKSKIPIEKDAPHLLQNYFNKEVRLQFN